jgi:hypothetical protein
MNGWNLIPSMFHKKIKNCSKIKVFFVNPQVISGLNDAAILTIHTSITNQHNNQILKQQFNSNDHVCNHFLGTA